MQDLDMTGPLLGMLVKALKISDFAMKKKVQRRQTYFIREQGVKRSHLNKGNYYINRIY